MYLTDLGQRLPAEMAEDSDRDFSPLIYETARVAALAPRLAGHEDRIRHLVEIQHQDSRSAARVCAYLLAADDAPCPPL